MGPFPIEDSFEMGAAIVMLTNSLNMGLNNKTVQFSTIQKFRSAFSMACQVTVDGQQSSVMARDLRKLIGTKFPTCGVWFEKFIKEMHKGMGDTVKADKALSLEILHEDMRTIEEDWENSPQNHFALSSKALFYLIAFCCALRGEEVPLTDASSMMKYWEEGGSHAKPHVIVRLIGCFKGETGISYLILPVIATTPRGLGTMHRLHAHLSQG